MPHQVAHVGNRLGVVVFTVIGNRKHQVELAQGRLGLDLYQHGQGARREQRRLDQLPLMGVVGYGAEQRYYQGFQLVQGLGAQHCQAHDISRIMGFVKADQFIPHARIRPIGQGLE